MSNSHNPLTEKYGLFCSMTGVNSLIALSTNVHKAEQITKVMKS